MWESIKDLVTGAKEALGIELPEVPVVPVVPELPVDLGAAGEAATNAGQQAAGAAAETVTGLPGAAAETVTGLPGAAAESAAQGLPDLPDLSGVRPDVGRG